VITLVVGVVILALAFSVVLAIARDRGPNADDVAVAYELAWDRLDFESVFTLSGGELRDGLDRRGFVAAKRSAYEQRASLGGLVERVGVDQVATAEDAAIVITRVELRDGTMVHNRVELARRSARWQVVAYRLEPSTEDTPHAGG
jgi:hypothetical protein